MNISVIGGGLVGLATASALAKKLPHGVITLHEKERSVGMHQSTHNSGVLHAGLYYKPGSLKAKLAVSGIRRMVAFCRDHGVPYEICGKIVVATADKELPILKELFERGQRNGLSGLRWLKREELHEIEPHAAGLCAVLVPEEGIVNYEKVCSALRTSLEAAGVRVLTGSQVVGLARANSGWVVETTSSETKADFIVNCGGLYCDRIARMAGENPDIQIVPFRGEYYRLAPSAEGLVRNLIYPVPDPAFPFLGVHFTRLITGGIEAGPNAVLAMGREGYTKWHIRPFELAQTLTFPGTWRFMRRHRQMALSEVRRSFSKELFCASLQRLVPEVKESDLSPGGAGVRAQAMRRDGLLVQDFEILERGNALHVLNAPSPAATASLEIGDYIADRAITLIASRN